MKQFYCDFCGKEIEMKQVEITNFDGHKFLSRRPTFGSWHKCIDCKDKIKCIECGIIANKRPKDNRFCSDKCKLSFKVKHKNLIKVDKEIDRLKELYSGLNYIYKNIDILRDFFLKDYKKALCSNLESVKQELVRLKEHDEIGKIGKFRLKKFTVNGKYGLSEEEYSKITEKCAICGFDKIVDLHHIDLNKLNNNKDNLIGLCPNHHMMIHRFKLKLEELRHI